MAEKKSTKEMSFRSKIYFLILLAVIIFAVILLYKYFDNQAVLRECAEIEQEILMNPELQKLNSTCICQPGRLYKNKINYSAELDSKAELRYMVICQSNNQTRLYPIWKSK